MLDNWVLFGSGSFSLSEALTSLLFVLSLKQNLTTCSGWL